MDGKKAFETRLAQRQHASADRSTAGLADLLRVEAEQLLPPVAVRHRNPAGRVGSHTPRQRRGAA